MPIGFTPLSLLWWNWVKTFHGLKFEFGTPLGQLESLLLHVQLANPAGNYVLHAKYRSSPAW